MRKLLLLSSFLLSIAFTSCKDNSAGLTHFQVSMTDAPGAYDSLLLSIKEIQVFTSEGQSVLPVDTKPFDILQYRFGKDTILAGQDIPSGRIQEVRLVLNTTGNRVVIDGESFNLTTPSGQASGVKLKIHDELVSGIGYTLKLDFDAAKSVVKTGSKKYVLKPVIRTIPNAVTGAITGIVSPAESNPKIFAITGTDTIGTVSDSTGKFFFPGVSAGTYKVEFKPDSPYVAKSISDVVVVNGSVKDLGTINISK